MDIYPKWYEREWWVKDRKYYIKCGDLRVEMPYYIVARYESHWLEGLLVGLFVIVTGIFLIGGKPKDD